MKTEIFELNDATQNKILRDIGKALTSTLDQEKVLNMIMEFIGNYYRPENWSLLLVDEEKFDLYFAIAVGKTSDLIKDKRLKIGQGIAGWSLTHKETVLIRDAYQDERFNPAFDKESGFRTSSIICVPMVNQGKALGIIELINIQEHFFEKPYVQLLETLADFAAIAIENSRYISRIKEVSIKDDCTNLYNSRHMIELLEIEMKRAKRGKNTREIANILLKNIRSSDWAIRYGGDEFVLILPGMNQENAFKLTKRIREELNSTVFFQKEGYNIHITASFGIAVFPKDASTIDEIIKMADHAMYDVKKRGRDNIQLAIK